MKETLQYQALVDTVKRGLAKIETDKNISIEELYKTLKVMGSVCQTAAETVKNYKVN